ncbi:MAG: glycerophosphodiester phosphodiesterase [Marmoricola sp.]|nr:glycerophosphodiester phosphodiesterase [Marmoricola sp.]
MARRSARNAHRPQVIAHRGASGHRPEHTLAAYELGWRLGADSVELDVLATSDGVVVCLHDLELSATTDVAAHPEFAHLRTTLEVDGKVQTGWFVHDFTLAELKQLTVKERWPKKRPGSASYDGRFAIPTLAEVIELRENEAARAGRRLGLHIELKAPAHLRRQGLWLPELVGDLVDDLDVPDLSWLSFDAAALIDLGANRSVGLLDATPSSRDLSRIAGYASAIGVARKVVLPRDSAGRIGEESPIVAKAHRRGLDVLVWTHRVENKHLPTNLQIGDRPHAHGDGVGEAARLFQAGIDALISDFPEIANAGRARLSDLPLAR